MDSQFAIYPPLKITGPVFRWNYFPLVHIACTQSPMKLIAAQNLHRALLFRILLNCILLNSILLNSVLPNCILLNNTFSLTFRRQFQLTFALQAWASNDNRKAAYRSDCFSNFTSLFLSIQKRCTSSLRTMEKKILGIAICFSLSFVNFLLNDLNDLMAIRLLWV